MVCEPVFPGQKWVNRSAECQIPVVKSRFQNGSTSFSLPFSIESAEMDILTKRTRSIELVLTS